MRRASRGYKAVRLLQRLVGFAERGLTPRSTGPATARPLGRATGTQYIFCVPAKRPCLRGPVSSNVRPRRAASLVLHAQLRAATCPVFSLRRGTSRSVCRGLAHRLCPRSGRCAGNRTREKTGLPHLSQFFKAAQERGRRSGSEGGSSENAAANCTAHGAPVAPGNSQHGLACLPTSAGPSRVQNQRARPSTQHGPDTARPNPSLNRTRYGQAPWPGPRQQ